MTPQEYLDQVEKQLVELSTEFRVDPDALRLVLNTVVGFGQARYNDGFTDGVIHQRENPS